MSVRSTYEIALDSVKVIEDVLAGVADDQHNPPYTHSAVVRNADHLKIVLEKETSLTAEQKAVLQKAITDGEAWFAAQA